METTPKNKTPHLDAIENGPWPKFVDELKSNIISIEGERKRRKEAKEKKENAEALQRILDHADQLDW